MPLFSTAGFDGTAAATTATGDGGASTEPPPAESAEGEDDDDGRQPRLGVRRHTLIVPRKVTGRIPFASERHQSFRAVIDEPGCRRFTPQAVLAGTQITSPTAPSSCFHLTPSLHADPRP